MAPEATPASGACLTAAAPPVRRLRLPPAAPESGSPDWGACRLTPLGRGEVALEACSLDLDGMTVQTGRCTPLAGIGQLPAGAAWLVLPLAGRETLRVRGRVVGARGVVVLGAGAEYELASPRDLSWGLVAMPAEAAGALVWQPRGRSLRRRGGAAVIAAPPAAWQRAAALCTAIAEVAATSPEVFAAGTARSALRDALLDACHDLLAGPMRADRPARPVGASPACRRLVRAADAAVAAEPGSGVDHARLAASLGVAQARLCEAFLRVLGVSAARYLLRRRLAGARAALQAEGDEEPVAAIARRHGFQDLAPFRRAYRALYAVDPSAGRGRPRPAVSEGAQPNIAR